MSRGQLFVPLLCALTAFAAAQEIVAQPAVPQQPLAARQDPVPGRDEVSPLFPVEVKGRYGFMDASGRVVIAPKFVGGAFFDGAVGMVMLPSRIKPRKINGLTVFSENVMAFIDRTGKLLFRTDALAGVENHAKVSGVGPLAEERAEIAVVDPASGRAYRGYVDSRGKLVIAPQFDMTEPFSNGLAAVASFDDYRWGFIDRSGASVVPGKFRNAKPFSSGLAAVQDMDTELWGYVDTQGNFVIAPRFTDAWPFADGYAVAETAEGRFVIDKSGKVQGEAAPGLGVLAEGLIAFNEGGRNASVTGWSRPDAVSGGKWGYRTAGGDTVLSAEFDFANAFSEGLAAVNFGGTYKDGIVQDGVWGYIDRTGRTVIAPQFAEAGAFRGGLAQVDTPGAGLFDRGSRSFYIDKAGNEVVPRDRAAPAVPAAAAASARRARELVEKGKVAEDQHDQDGALAYYSQAVAADSHLHQAYYSRGGIQAKRARWTDAIRDFSTTIALEPRFGEAYQKRAMSFAMVGDLDKALSDFNAAIRYDPELEPAYLGRIIVYIGQGKFDLARQEATRLQQRGVAVPYRITSRLRQQSDASAGSNSSIITVNDALDSSRPRNLQSAAKISGLFVGISNYPGQAPQSGPAHTFGAALFHEIFYRAEANRLGMKIERSGTGDFVSEYRTAPGEQLFTTKGGGGWFSMTVAMIGRMPQPEIPNLKLIADLRIDPRDYDTNPEAVVRLLASIDGSWLQLRDNRRVPVALSPPGLTWPYFGRGDYVSRQKLLTELQGSLERTTAAMQQQDEVFVFYVAAHGGIGKDGTPFIFTADPDHPDERIGYREILDLVAQKGAAPQGRRLIKIVVFDACQTLEADAGKDASPGDAAIADLHLPPDTILITSTSPGRYAMHLPSVIRETRFVTDATSGLFGEQAQSSFDQEFASTSSAFPIASHLALKDASGSATITIDQWLGGIQRSLTRILPRSSPAGAQTVIVRRPEPQAVMPVLFNVLKSEGDGR